MKENFVAVEEGYIVYKKIGGGKTKYLPPGHWKIEEGEVLEEVVNSDRGTDCGCGVNFGTLEWCTTKYKEASLWECLIKWKDLPDVIVPYNTDGKARCEKLTLLKKVASRLERRTG
jgi:hypothetical protein